MEQKTKTILLLLALVGAMLFFLRDNDYKFIQIIILTLLSYLLGISHEKLKGEKSRGEAGEIPPSSY